MNVWYDLSSPQAWELYIRQDTILNDTVKVEALAKTEFLQNAKLSQTNGRSTPVSVNPDQFISIDLNHPVANVDTSLIRMYEDTLRIPVQAFLEIDSLKPRSVKLRTAWKEGLPYEFEALPGAFQDIFGLQSDTIKAVYRAELRKTFGNLNLKIEGFQADTNYVVQLLQGETLVDELQVSGVETFEKAYKGLRPGDYSVKIIVDLNANGRWDSGNYNMKIQPEVIITKKLETLRANWDVESVISL
ncbi:MAG: hypothetical protein IPJ74_10500 [Saprospiraceae bacterium]|nr:hypothetical protein [Saprospiraceae bacterium]